MAIPELYVSRPAVALPSERLSNEDVLTIVRQRYKGPPEAWPMLEAAIRNVFERCGSEWRYLDPAPTTRVAAFAARAATLALERAGHAATDLDMAVYGGIAREYLEPATAMELSALLGAERLHAFDVTSACVGFLEALAAVAGHFALDERRKVALVATGELSREYLSYDIQSLPELAHRAAGLTIGNAAAAVLVTRTPTPGGCARLVGMHSRALPKHWALCTVPVGGAFTSFSTELFRLHVHVAPEVRELLGQVGWAAGEVDHYVFHQPSNTMVRKVLDELGVSHERGAAIHGLYANTVSAALPVTLDHLLREGRVRHGDRIVLATAAAGLSIATAALVWHAPAE